ncbi:SMI1/KNR4 family protein [Bremerella sp. T1]|uniref:SMI1/KNR4 family protein n=1 Tax=Bremerella sp. TYQ1 TaxID=3119568 RepID=UPI001CC9BF3B|nr:SMI1/KNR4 family protein [Bremerella volcania]UBM34858.1 hypothetical protein LA756_19480 [Bremerella volcania]
MTEAELDQIADALAVVLPQEYRELMQTRGKWLAATGLLNDELSPLYLKVDRIVQDNHSFRDRETMFGQTYPQWWKTFFLIGTNGAAGFYALRWDGTPGVWLLGGIFWEPEPSKLYDSLAEFVEDKLETAQDHMRMKPIWDARHKAERDDHAAKHQAYAEKGMPWECQWEHPTIDGESLKAEMAKLGVSANGQADPLTRQGLLQLADWIASQGDKAWARQIRLRVELASKPPGEDYVALREDVLEVTERTPRTAVKFTNFYHGIQLRPDEWFDNRNDCSRFGIPFVVDAVSVSDNPRPIEQLISDVEQLVQQTPVRGIDLDDNYEEDIAAILNSAGGRHLRWLGFNLGYNNEGVRPQIQALVESPTTSQLETLYLHSHLNSDDDAVVLAGAAFDRLRTLRFFDVCGPNCSAEALTQLMQAAWFRRLEEVSIRFSDKCCETGLQNLAEMPNLHSLALRDTAERTFQALPRTGAFPALQRLVVEARNLTGKLGEAFCQWQTPQLQEFWLKVHKAKSSDLQAILSASFLKNARILNLHSGKLDAKCLTAIAKHSCAAKLRGLHWNTANEDLEGNMRSLAKTPLTEAGAFPNLTTLSISRPFSQRAWTDTAKFFKNLQLPKLRCLTLNECAFDDAAAEALANNPSLSRLRTLVLRAGWEENKFTARGAEKLFRSPVLNNLRHLEIQDSPVGSCLPLLLKQETLPHLISGVFYKCEASPQVAKQLKATRPLIRVVD